MPVRDLGAQDPSLENSPIVTQLAQEDPAPEIDETQPSSCRFNGESFPHGSRIKSGATVLSCEHGVWVDAGLEEVDYP